MVLRTTRSTVSASQTPLATRSMASRHSACCRRLPTKPGTSRCTRTGILPTNSSTSNAVSIDSVDVWSPRTISTTGMRSGGFHQCMPTVRSAPARPSVMREMGITEELLASSASGAAVRAAAKSARLASRSSTMASMTRSALATAAARFASPTMCALGAIDRASVNALSSTPGWESVSTTGNPERAMTPAIRRPIRPAPTTATDPTGCAEPVSTRCSRRRGTAPVRS